MNQKSRHRLEDSEPALNCLLDAIRRRQFEQSARDARFLIVEQPHFCGFGCQLTMLYRGLILGHLFDRTLIYDRGEDHTYVGFFKSIGKHTIDDAKEYPFVPLEFTHRQEEKVVKLDFLPYYNDPLLRRQYENWSIPELKWFKYGHDYVCGKMYGLFELKDAFSEHVEQKKKEIEFEGPAIGVHVRRGDKHAECPDVPLVAIDEYFRRIEETSVRTGIKRVFVTSDSASVLDSLPVDRGYEFICDRTEARYDNANHSFLKSRPLLRERETMTCVKILEMLASCDYIIGQRNAHLSYMAAGIRMARTFDQGCYLPIEVGN